MNKNNTGCNRLVSSFNLGGQGTNAGSGAYHIYDTSWGGSKEVSQSTYNSYNQNYDGFSQQSYNSASKGSSRCKR